MILRNIAAQLRARNWLAVATELLIVIIGVFLGLQAQEWNQERLDRRQEKEYIERLAVEFDGIHRKLGRCLAVYRDSVAAIDTVARALEQSTGPDSTPDAAADPVSTALIRMTAGDIPAGRSTTFVEMLSTGDLGVLRDPELREALVSYDQRAQINRDIWRSLRTELASHTHPLYEHVTISVQLDRDPISSIIDYDLEAMAADQAVRSMLNAIGGIKGNLFELCGAQRKQVEEAQRLLEGQQ